MPAPQTTNLSYLLRARDLVPSPQTTRDARSSQCTRTETFALNALFNGLRRLPCPKNRSPARPRLTSKETRTIFACETRTTTSTHRSRKKTPKRFAPKSIRVVPIRVVRIPHRIPHPDRPHNPPLRTSTSLSVLNDRPIRYIYYNNLLMSLIMSEVPKRTPYPFCFYQNTAII